MAKIKLLHITSSLKVGGAETLLCNLIEHLPTTQFEHQVIYFHDGPMRSRLDALGIKTFHMRGAVSLYDPLFWVRLWWRVRAIRPHKIHALLWAANVAARLVGSVLRIPVVCAYHNNVNQDGLLRNIVDRATFGLAKKHVAVSDEVARSIVNNVVQVGNSTMIVINNGIDVDGVARIARVGGVPRSALGFHATDIVIGSVGRFVPVKNYPLLIRAFARVYQCNPRVRLVLVGQGQCEGALRSLVDELGISAVVFFVVGKQAVNYYSIFDLFVQSSDQEGISLALLEAMATGITCVATCINGYHPVIQHQQNGFLVSAGDEQALAHTLAFLANNHSLLQECGKHAYATVYKHFNQSRMITRYAELFEQLSC